MIAKGNCPLGREYLLDAATAHQFVLAPHRISVSQNTGRNGAWPRRRAETDGRG